MPLEALRLLALAAFLDSVDETRTAIRRAPGSFPRLEAISGGAASFKSETTATRDKIDPSGEVVDHASPELKIIRDRLRKQRSRLRSTLESYLRGKETAKHLQDQVVTERNGRYVLVVKAEHRGAIPGIVHGSSTSGASLFLEPLSTVEINNDIVALEEQEHEEVLRILLALTDAFRARPADMQQTIEAATELDVVQARARFSESIDGIEPALTSDGRVRAAGGAPSAARACRAGHDQGDSAGHRSADYRSEYGRQDRRAQDGGAAGADGAGRTAHSRRRRDRACRCSSRSSRTSATSSRSKPASARFRGTSRTSCRWTSRCVTPALVLLDEVGSGTDPIEGGALGVAIVDHFRKRGATIIATSHYDQLKTYASTAEGVTSAAFGFDADTFAPTYRAHLRLARAAAWRSRSPARLGLNPAVVAARPREPERARGAARRAPCQDRSRHARARARAPARGARA